VLCYDCEARCRLDRVALRQGASEGARIIKASRQGGKVRARQGGKVARWQGARRDDRASRHRATRSSRSGEASCVIDAHARARGWRDPDNQNLSRERAPFKQSIKKNPIIMIFYFLDRI